MRSDLEARLALLERELRDVDLQEAAGELDAATATRLRTTYRAERDQTESELRNSTISEEKDRRRSPQRMLIGGVVLVASFVLIVVAAVGALTEDPTPAPLGSDLSQISNEAMLAGEVGPKLDICLVNASAALVAADVAEGFVDGVAKARSAVESGAAAAVLDRVIERSQAFGS